MTVQIFLTLVTVFAVVTSLITEAVKKFLDSLNVQYASNLVVLASSVLVGGLGTAIFYVFMGYNWNAINVVCIFLMILANWLVSMLGYDKVMQAITQMKGGNANG